MANPAQQLLEILENWVQDPGQGAKKKRGLEGTGRSSLEPHRRAMRLLVELETLCAGFAEMGSRSQSMDRSLENLTRWICAYPFGWGPSSSAQPPKAIETLDFLELLAQRIDDQETPVNSGQREQLADAVSDARQLLIESSDLPNDLKFHLHTLIAEADTCLQEYEMRGDFSLKQATERLFVAMDAAERMSKQPERWRAAKDKLGYPVLVGITVKAADIAADVLGITGGQSAG